MDKLAENPELRRVMELSEFPIAVYRFIDGKVVTILVSQGLIKLQAPGYTREMLLDHFNNDMYSNVHPDDSKFIIGKAKAFALDDHGRYEAVYREKLYGKDTYSKVHAFGYHHFAADGTRYAIIYYDDVSRAETNARLDAQSFGETLAEVLDNGAPNGFVIITKDTHEILFFNSLMSKYWQPVRTLDTGVTLEQYVLKEGESFEFSVEELLERGEIISADKLGQEFVVSGTAMNWRGRAVVMIRVTEKDSRYYDALTGLPNIDYYRQRAEKALEIIRARGENPSIIYTDIQGMRRFNDNFGFEAGDQLLKRCANSLSKHFKKSWVFRATVDHFIVLTGERKIMDLLSAVNDEINAAYPDHTTEICAGVFSPAPNEKFDLMNIYDRAKGACEVAEKSGRFKVLYYDHELERDAKLREYVVCNIDKAIREGWIKAFYQPVVRTVSKTFCGMEALARWVDPVYGLLNPASFIESLESSHQIHKLDKAMIEQVCKDMRRLLDEGREIVPVSFNLSKLDFVSGDMLKYVDEMVEKYHLDRGFIRIEITETVMAADAYVRSQVKRFRKAGYEVWMDDFGSGYSSLNVLKDYEFDELKIDMAFLSSMSEVSRTIIRSIVGMAKSIGIKTLAEGVETEEQFDFLRDIGCQKAQGFYFGKPSPLDETLANLAAQNIKAEDSLSKRCFSAMGRVDFIEFRPMAILAFDDKEFRFLFSSAYFQHELNGVGISNPKEMELILNDRTSDAHELYVQTEKRMRESGEFYATRFPLNGIYVALQSRKIFEEGDYRVYTVSAYNTAISVMTIKETSERIGGEKKRILIASAEQNDRLQLGKILKEDYEVLYAADGVQALELLRQYADSLDVGIFDLLMPGMNGFEAIRTFRQEGHTGVSFIIMTGEEVFTKRSVELGAANFIQKPLPDAEIVKAYVENAIAGMEKLQAASQRYMEFMPGGVILYKATEEEEIVYTNQHLLDLFECETKEEFSDHTGGSFRGAVYEEDYAPIKAAIGKQVRDKSNIDFVTYRIRTKKGNIVKVDDYARLVDDPQYGKVFVALLFVDTAALKEYKDRRLAFNRFLDDGEATNTKSYDTGYKGYLIWNLTKNGPAVKMGGISYIPDNLKDKYTYDEHLKLLYGWMEREEDYQKVAEYDREHLINIFEEGREVKPFSISYHIGDLWFSIRSVFTMMRDPDSGDIFLRIQNVNDTKAVAYERLVDAALGTLYRSLLYINRSKDSALVVTGENGHTKKEEVRFSEFFAKMSPQMGINLSLEEWFRTIDEKCKDTGACAFIYRYEDGVDRKIDIKRLYSDEKHYFIAVSNLGGNSFAGNPYPQGEFNDID